MEISKRLAALTHEPKYALAREGAELASLMTGDYWCFYGTVEVTRFELWRAFLRRLSYVEMRGTLRQQGDSTTIDLRILPRAPFYYHTIAGLIAALMLIPEYGPVAQISDSLDGALPLLIVLAVYLVAMIAFNIASYLLRSNLVEAIDTPLE